MIPDKCRRGHDLDGQNLYIPPGNPDTWQCRHCNRDRRSGKAAPIESIGRTCPQGHVVAGDNLYEAPSGRKACKACRRLSGRKNLDNLRDAVLEAYGRRCDCCGETTPEFLCLDHVGGWGADHRRSLTGTNKAHNKQIYRAARDAGWPDSYRLLCWNCNWGVTLEQGCPHKRKQVI